MSLEMIVLAKCQRCKKPFITETDAHTIQRINVFALISNELNLGYDHGTSKYLCQECMDGLNRFRDRQKQQQNDYLNGGECDATNAA